MLSMLCTVWAYTLKSVVQRTMTRLLCGHTYTRRTGGIYVCVVYTGWASVIVLKSMYSSEYNGYIDGCTVILLHQVVWCLQYLCKVFVQMCMCVCVCVYVWCVCVCVCVCVCTHPNPMYVYMHIIYTECSWVTFVDSLLLWQPCVYVDTKQVVLHSLSSLSRFIYSYNFLSVNLAVPCGSDSHGSCKVASS